MNLFSSLPILEYPKTGVSLLKFLVFSYPLLSISGQLVNSDTSGSWQWPSSSFISSVKSVSSSPSPEYQPNSKQSPPGNTPLFYPAYNPASSSGQPEDFSNLDLYNKTFYPLPFYFQNSSSSLLPNKQSFSSIQNGDQSYRKFSFTPQSEKLSPAGLGFSPPSRLPTIPNWQNDQLLPQVPSNIFVNSNPLNYPFIQPSGLNEQLKLPPEPSSPFFSFPNNDGSVLFSPKPTSPNFQPSTSGNSQDFLPHKSSFSPEPFTHGSIPPLSEYFPGDFGSSLLNGPPLFPDSPDGHRFIPLPFETVPQISPPFSLSSSVSGSPRLTSPSGFPDYFVDTSYKPLSSSIDTPFSPQGESSYSPLLPKVSGPITQSSEAIPQVMTPYKPEHLNYEPSFSEIPSFLSFDSSGGLNSPDVQSEPSDFFNPDSVSEQPSLSQPSLDFDFPNLPNEEPEPSSAETIPSIVNEGSADQPAIINGSSEFPDGSECPANERYLKCGPSCPRTCRNFIRNLKCDKKECKPGCFCKRGLLRNKYGECVVFRRCNPVICRRREVFRSCGPSCETTCENYGTNSACSSDECVHGCFCRNGLVRHSDGRCVKPEHCEIESLNVPEALETPKEPKILEDITSKNFSSVLPVITSDDESVSGSDSSEENKASEMSRTDLSASGSFESSKFESFNPSEVQDAVENKMGSSATSEADEKTHTDMIVSSVPADDEESPKAGNRSITDSSVMLLSSLPDEAGDLESLPRSSWGAPPSGYHNTKDQEFSSTPDIQEEYSPFGDSSGPVSLSAVSISADSTPADDQGPLSDQSSSNVSSPYGQNMRGIHDDSGSDFPSTSEIIGKGSSGTEEMLTGSASLPKPSSIPDVSDILLPSEMLPYLPGPEANKEAISSSSQDSSDVTYSDTSSDILSEANSGDSSSAPSTTGSETDSDISSKENSSDGSSVPSTTSSETDSDVPSEANSSVCYCEPSTIGSETDSDVSSEANASDNSGASSAANSGSGSGTSSKANSSASSSASSTETSGSNSSLRSTENSSEP